jgi:EAL domain-containing protein (putative c-di-GMP-specific phosphodiesterase class I)
VRLTFGTGYSSVALLRDLLLDTIKIDLSFTSCIDTGPRVADIVRGLDRLCGEFGITVVAEGVETAGQDKFLRSFDCLLGQGYLHGRPETIVTSSVAGHHEVVPTTLRA